MASSNAFEGLPNELLLKIFRYCNTVDLLNMAMVCKQWFQLCKDRSLFQNLIFSNNMDIDKIKMILSWTAMCLSNGKVNLIIIDRLDSTDILAYFTNLLDTKEETKFSFFFKRCFCCLVCRDMMLEIGFLKDDLSCISKNSLTITSSSNDVALMLLDTINSHYSYDCPIENIEVSFIKPIYHSCTSKSSMSCFCVSATELVKLCRNLLVFRCKYNIHKIFKTTLNNTSCDDRMKFIFHHLCTSNNQLQVLEISALSLLDDDILMLKNLRNITVLHLYGARKLSATSLEVFGTFKELKSFLMSENIMISSWEWKQFIDHSELKSIESLGFDECLVDDSVMFSIGRECKKLKKITLNGCRNDSCVLTSEGIKAVFCMCEKLEEVSLLYVDKELQCAFSYVPGKVKKLHFNPVN